MDWSSYRHLTFEYPDDGILLIKINRPDRLNAMNAPLHTELSQVWLDVDKDDDCRAVVITGEGKAFSAGGDFEMVEATLGSYQTVTRLFKEAGDLVHNITDISKPVISAINGTAVGAGLAVALTADISIMSETARFTDGHHKLGVAAGDHAAFIWPLLCGMAKARYYLLTNDFIDGREAERIGLVSKCAPADEVLPEALRVAAKLAAGPRHATAATKRTLNHWLRQATPIFENALALEMLQFFSDDAREGYEAMREKRAPKFPSNRGAQA
ncbi:enoyl-CoA hydratase/isomerase family protein [Streptomyces sp. NPDC058175]|uniref:enoyl-CoA hydratase/isomerase family protein n=1 Tax=Streptomyces sp. NPDC058175 TaxID=3346367 RepID=UPI0036EA0434